MARWPVLLAITLAIAGCVEATPEAPPADEQETPAGPDAVDRPIDAGPAAVGDSQGEVALPIMIQGGCTSHYSFHQVASSFFDPFLPVDFEVATADGQTAEFGVKSWDCSDAAIDATASASSPTTLYYVEVEPPSPYQAADVTSHWVVVELIATGPIASYFQELGFPVVQTSSYTSERLDAPRGQVWHTAVGAENGASIELEIAAELASERRDHTGNEYVIRYFAVQDKQVLSVVDIDVSGGTSVLGTSLLDLRGDRSPFDERVVGDGQAMWWTAGQTSYVWTPEPPL